MTTATAEKPRMVVANCVQGSPEWFAARCGIPTASNFDKIVTTKGEPSKQAQKYLYQLAGERITGRTEEGFKNAAMERGQEVEAEARNLYEMVNDLKIEQVGVCYPDEKKLCAASPDGLVGRDGLIELKCPLVHTHVGYLLDNCLPTEYFTQTQGQLYVTGRKWVDFMSYFPGLKPLIIRVTRNEEFIAKLDAELKAFNAELVKVTEKIR